MVIKKTAAKKAGYTSANIKTLVFPESVRRNASQYIGGTDSYGLWMIIKELLDNGLDEALAKRNDMVGLVVDKDGSFWVSDRGHGVPQGITKTKIHVNGKDVINKMPTMQAVFGALNTSGKYDTAAYEVSIGTHGIGSKGTNATCEFFEVWTYFEKEWHTIGFKKGVLVKPVAKCKAPKGPDGSVMKSGTLIHCKPDMSIFSSSKFPTHMAWEWAEMMAYFNPGVEIHIETTQSEKKFVSEHGVRDYIDARLKKLKSQAEKIIFEYRAVHGDPHAADVVVAFSDYGDCDLRGFTNGSLNSKGGKHVDSVTGALYTALKPYIKTRKIDGKPVPVFREGDLKEGLVGIVNAKLHKAKFNSQDKVFLSDERMGKGLEDKLIVEATKFFKENKALALRLCEKATKINELKTQFNMSKKAVADLNKVKRLGLPAKYAGFDPKTKVHDRELFLTEGDSATGKLKEARFPFQAILPLRGKIMNALKPSKKKTPLDSEEVINILAAIGYDPKAADPYSKLTMGKIICLADPDPDGPFVGETLIRIKESNTPDAEPHEVSIANLEGRTFYAPVWTGGEVQWKEAFARMEHNVSQIVAMEIGGHKYKVDLNHKFLVVRTPAVRGRIAKEYNDDLAYVRAQDMRIGDRVYCPTNEAGRRDWEKQDKMTGRGFLAVNKLRIQELAEPVPVYCLTVPKYHNFMLPSGIVSSNCHINSLLLTLFYKYLPELFARGMVYVSAIPEFYAVHKQQLVTGDSVSVMKKKLLKIKAPSSVTINHLKGWGEAPKNLLKILACDPETRRLIRISAIEKEDTVEFVKLMDEDVEYRRKIFGLPSSATQEDDEEEVKPARKTVAKKVIAKKTVKKASPLREVEAQKKLENARQHVRKVLKATKPKLRKAA
jgi:DNA gyrase/topoisomerase IV subunit B